MTSALEFRGGWYSSAQWDGSGTCEWAGRTDGVAAVEAEAVQRHLHPLDEVVGAQGGLKVLLHTGGAGCSRGGGGGGYGGWVGGGGGFAYEGRHCTWPLLLHCRKARLLGAAVSQLAPLHWDVPSVALCAAAATAARLYSRRRTTVTAVTHR